MACCHLHLFFFFFQAEDGIRDAQESRGLGDVYKRQRPGRGRAAAWRDRPRARGGPPFARSRRDRPSLERRGQAAHGPPPVADSILLLRRRLAEALLQLVAEEVRIVAEPAGAGRLLEDSSGAAALEALGYRARLA